MSDARHGQAGPTPSRSRLQAPRGSTMRAMSVGYDSLYVGVLALTSPWWGYRLLRTGKWRTDWPGRLGRGASIAQDGRCTLLIHAVSVGEVNAIGKLVSVLHGRCHDTVRIVISTTTDTGLARARQLFEPMYDVVRYPLDLGPCVGRFLDRVRPDLVALTELEVWPGFVDRCVDRGVPVCVINGRLSARSYRRYRLVGRWVRPVFSRLTAVAAQTSQYAGRFEQLGVPPDRVRVLDSMKWDTATVPADASGVEAATGLARAMGIDTSRPLIVAGSTGPGEERLLIDRCPRDAQLLLAPRKPDRFDEVAALEPGIVRRSEHPDATTPAPSGARIFLLDTMGELRRAYALADVAIVGRSFLGQYGSNPMEPVALGKPTVIGPHYDDFVDTVEALRDGGGICIASCPGQAVSRLLADRALAQDLADRGRRVIISRQGATERHADLLLSLMPGVRAS